MSRHVPVVLTAVLLLAYVMLLEPVGFVVSTAWDHSALVRALEIMANHEIGGK